MKRYSAVTAIPLSRTPAPRLPAAVSAVETGEPEWDPG